MAIPDTSGWLMIPDSSGPNPVGDVNQAMTICVEVLGVILMSSLRYGH